LAQPPGNENEFSNLLLHSLSVARNFFPYTFPKIAAFNKHLLLNTFFTTYDEKANIMSFFIAYNEKFILKDECFTEVAIFVTVYTVSLLLFLSDRLQQLDTFTLKNIPDSKLQP
jgi:hypothetical protein